MSRRPSPLLLLPRSVPLPSEPCIAPNNTMPRRSPNASTSSGSAQLRKCRKKDENFISMQDLAAALDASLKDTDGGVLPSSTHVAPNSGSGWRATAAAMMPGIKGKKEPAGDEAYGGGASSGAKAPKRRKEVRYGVTIQASHCVLIVLRLCFRTDIIPVNVPFTAPISVQQAPALPVTSSSTHGFHTNSTTVQNCPPRVHPHPDVPPSAPCSIRVHTSVLSPSYTPPQVTLYHFVISFTCVIFCSFSAMRRQL
ncbi:hypothetical protein K438DRAFT_2029824 [Mycena galopus ATCC 62051]|nr:hypothetical protein K438DRAFT_2029824 [Mycena galopus ATCC 62051]